MSILRLLHDRLDAAAADAYGWPRDLSDADIIARVVALDAERAAEEASGTPGHGSRGSTSPMAVRRANHPRSPTNMRPMARYGPPSLFGKGASICWLRQPSRP